MNQLQEFWKDIEHLSYMSAVKNYEDNGFDKILKKYGLKRSCEACGK